MERILLFFRMRVSFGEEEKRIQKQKAINNCNYNINATAKQISN